MSSRRPVALVALLLLAALPGCANLFGASCRYRTLVAPQVADTRGVARVRVVAQAGSLDVTAVPGLAEARARGEACASSHELLEQVRLELSREGDTLVVAAVEPEHVSGACGLDLVVELPEGLPVVVVDGSGSLRITGTAGADVTDGSGSITLRDIRGDVSVTDGSGSVDVEGVDGDVRLSDGSGSLTVADVRGSVIVVTDGSGSIDVADVTGDVTVQVDGSGGIDVRRVGGAFTVVSDGSGGIDHREVAGRVSLPGR